MEKIIIALLTPRAGRWNHRFLVPENSSVRDSDLTRVLEKLDVGDDRIRPGLLLKATEQQQGGRFSEEILFLYCENFDKIVNNQPSLRNEVEGILKKWFEGEGESEGENKSKREELIESFPWEEKGEPILIECPELTKLQGEIEQCLSESEELLTKSDRKRPSPPVSLLKMMLFVISVILLLVILFRNGIISFQNPMGPTIKEETIAEKNKKELTENEDFQIANESIFQQLFDWKASEPISQGESTEQPEKEIENELTNVLHETWRFRGLPSLSSLDEYKKNNDIKSLLEQKKAGKILILGDVSDEERKNWVTEFGDMSDQKLIQFHKIVNSLFELQLKILGEEKKKTLTNPIFTVIFDDKGKIELPENMSSKIGWNKEIPLPKFLFAYNSDSPHSDLKHAKAVKHILKVMLEQCICDKTELNEITTLSALFEFYDKTLKKEINVNILKDYLVENGLNKLSENNDIRQPLNDLLLALNVSGGS